MPRRVSLQPILWRAQKHNSAKAEFLSADEARDLYQIFIDNKRETLIYSKKQLKIIRQQIGWKGLLKFSDWKKIKAISEWKPSQKKQTSDKNNQQQSFRGNYQRVLSERKRLDSRKTNTLLENVTLEISNQKWDIRKILNQMNGEKHDCYNLLYQIAKRSNNPVLKRFLEHNSSSGKIIPESIRDVIGRVWGYHKKYVKSAMQFLRSEQAEYIPKGKFNRFMDRLDSAKEGSVFVTSMNWPKTSGNGKVEHTGFITIKNGKSYLTHWETFIIRGKQVPQWAKTHLVSREWWYFNSTPLRKNFKEKWYFHLLKIQD